MAGRGETPRTGDGESESKEGGVMLRWGKVRSRMGFQTARYLIVKEVPAEKLYEK
jgi:hypothetical protein